MENHHRTPLIAVAASFFPLGTAIIAVRFWVRTFVHRSVTYDDYLIYIAWIATIAYATASSIALKRGIGLFQSQLTPQEVTAAIHSAYFVELFYFISVYFVKLSILAFYYRLPTAIRGTFWKINLLFIGILSAHFVSTIIVEVLKCQPISYFWNKNQKGSCINLESFYYSTNIFTIISDIAILLLPIPTLMKSFRSTSTRLAILTVFLAGILSTVSSCVRLYTIRIFTSTSDPVYDAAPITLWSIIEINVGLMCASGSALKQAFMYFRPPQRLGTESSTDVNEEMEVSMSWK